MEDYYEKSLNNMISNRIKNNNYIITSLLSLCHMGIDFLCVFSLYRLFYDRYEAFLFYNFCAFALQMPLGLIIDFYSFKSKSMIKPGMVFTIIGIILTISGSFISNIILGIGNAFFHVGAGVLVIHEDDNHKLKGKALGCFVAPGAVGLIIGILFNQTTLFQLFRLIVSILLFIIGILVIYFSEDKTLSSAYSRFSFAGKKLIYIIVLCFIIVLIRSFVGMSIVYPWKQGYLISIISVVMIAAGKAIGGFLNAYLGTKRTVIITLIISSIAYIFADNMLSGMIALLFFNMTMPITLYMLAKKMPDTPGFAFGILTFALFIGYLPYHYFLSVNLLPFPLATIASIVSLIALLIAISLSKEGIENE